MKRLQLYVLREHMKPFFLGLILIYFIFILNLLLDIMKMILSMGIPPLIVLKLILYNLAWMTALAVPMAVLVATVMAFGRLSSDSEYIAIKASGVSLYSMITPVLVAAICIGIGMVIFNHDTLPNANFEIERLKKSIKFMKPITALEAGKYTSINNKLEVYVEKINHETGEVEGIIIYDKRELKSETTIMAPRGVIDIFVNDGTAVINLFNGEIHRKDQGEKQYATTRFPRYQVNVKNLPVSGFRMTDKKYRSDRSKTTKQLLQDVEKNRDILVKREEMLERAIQDSEPEKSIQDRKKFIEMERKTISKFMVEVHKRNSIPVAVIVFTLIGAPLGAMVRRSGASIGISLSIGFFILYWSCLIGGEDLADRLMVPAWLAMWFPNILLGPVGIVLTMRAARR